MEMGFTCTVARTPTKKSPSSQGGISSSLRYTTFVTTDKAYASWKQPPHLARLLLDTAALSHVLTTGECLSWDVHDEGKVGGGSGGLFYSSPSFASSFTDCETKTRGVYWRRCVKGGSQ